MATGSKARIINIGNSKGIRIPKVLLEQADLGEEVEMEVQAGKLVIRPSRSPRFGWDDQFAKMAEKRDDQLPDAESISTSRWDTDEWEW